LAGVGEVFEPCAGKDIVLMEWYGWQWFTAIVLEVGKFGEVSPADAALVKVFVGTLKNHIIVPLTMRKGKNALFSLWI
jgi:hypothetical protein